MAECAVYWMSVAFWSVVCLSSTDILISRSCLSCYSPSRTYEINELYI
jgi:hypothetical protein